MGLKGSSVSLSGQVSITLQIPLGISEILSPSQLFQNLSAFPGLITTNFQSSLLYGMFLFHWRANGSFPAFYLCVSPVFCVSRRRFCPVNLAKTIQLTSAFHSQSAFSLPLWLFSALFMFSLHFSKCRSLALCILISDEVVVIDNTNNISCLAWQCRMQHPSLLCGASCRRPKTSDINLCVFQVAFFSLVNCKSCFEFCDVSIKNIKFHPISVALAYDCYRSPSACLSI